MRYHKATAALGLLLSHAAGGTLGADNTTTYSACPLIGQYYVPPISPKSSEPFTGLISDFTEKLDKLVEDSGSEKYGPITPNTTSFAVVLFRGGDAMKDDPVFFEYHYTSPQDQADIGLNITSNTKFPVGDLTMVFTVYAWLVEMGESWETPITKYLPELSTLSHSWNDVTVGSLAGQTSGLVRQTDACVIDGNCHWEEFKKTLAIDPFVFLPDTTPMVSYAAFQLLVFAMQESRHSDNFQSILDQALFKPLDMAETSLLDKDLTDVFAIDTLNRSQSGEPGAISLVSSLTDLSRAGHSILSASLLSSATTRRWLHHTTDTSNLRNGVGRPWESYRSGSKAISPVLDVFTKSGALGGYASYFGIAPDFDAGFAILAHDSTVADRGLDTNVYADVVSESIGYLQQIAAEEMAARFGGTYKQGNVSVAVLNITDDGPGLAMQNLIIDDVDIKSQTAKTLGMDEADLDFRLYPSDVQDSSKQHFVAVFQDKSAPIDAGTPTCITWQHVGAYGVDAYRFVFELDEGGEAHSFGIHGSGATLTRNA